jgi:hypothetical protein
MAVDLRRLAHQLRPDQLLTLKRLQPLEQRRRRLYLQETQMEERLRGIRTRRQRVERRIDAMIRNNGLPSPTGNVKRSASAATRRRVAAGLRPRRAQEARVPASVNRVPRRTLQSTTSFVMSVVPADRRKRVTRREIIDLVSHSQAASKFKRSSTGAIDQAIGCLVAIKQLKRAGRGIYTLHPNASLLEAVET